MPATTSKGYPYVLPADNVADYPTTSQQLANLLESVVPSAIAAGNTSVTLTALSNGSTAFTLPAGRFSQVPVFACNQSSGAGGTQTLIPRVLNPSTTGGTASFYSGNNTSVTVTSVVQWIAIQMTPASAPGILSAPTDLPSFVATCGTEGCPNFGHDIPLLFDPDQPPSRVECGVCGQPITRLEGITL